MAAEKDLLILVPGMKVMVSDCQARQHNCDDGCVCDLKGTVQTMGAPVESLFAGTPSWLLAGTVKRVRLAEVTFIKS